MMPTVSLSTMACSFSGLSPVSSLSAAEAAEEPSPVDEDGSAEPLCPLLQPLSATVSTKEALRIPAIILFKLIIVSSFNLN